MTAIGICTRSKVAPFNQLHTMKLVHRPLRGFGKRMEIFGTMPSPESLGGFRSGTA